MSKDIGFTVLARGQVKMTMTNHDRYGRKISSKQFTVPRRTLEAALKDAGIEREVNTYTEPPTTLDQDIALYQALSTMMAGPSSHLTDAGKRMSNKLWSRIQDRMNLK